MFDSIEHVVYINLDDRTDRRQQVQRELLSVFPASKITRFPAIRAPNGAVGCSMSHIAALEMAKQEGWKNVMIVEDDFAWLNFELSSPILTRLLANPFDVIVVGGTFVTYDQGTYKLWEGQTTTGYIVPQNYYDRLLTNFREGLALYRQTSEYYRYALDQYWKRLQATDNWFIVQPSLCTQQPGYSDIDKRVVDYTQYFK